MSRSQDPENTAFAMSFEELELYRRIQAFQIDRINVSLPFSKRLARENQWSLNYTHRVIEEYKKFLFLTMVADHPVTPSNAIDQTWHLHLTYTHSYWDVLCAQVLQKSLHHHPTQGGRQQRTHFWDCYCKTLASYERFFGDRAPNDIWASPTVRFRQAGQFKRVNDQEYWLIPKRPFKRFHQGVWQVPQLFKQSFILVALLALSFALSWSPAIAYLSSQAQQPFLSHLLLHTLPSFNLKIIQTLTILYPWSVLGIVLSIASFLIAIGGLFLPAFVHPVGVVENPAPDWIIEVALFISSIIASLTITLHALHQSNPFKDFSYGGWITLFYVGIFYVWITIFGFIRYAEYSFISSLTSATGGRFLRPIHCKNCLRRLNRLNSSNFLSRKEKVAAEIGSVDFEVWHCRSCCSAVNRASILLYRYVKPTTEFKQCRNCNEVTMKSFSKTLKEPTTSEEGRQLIDYRCQCCTMEEQRVESIPKLSDDVGCACC